VPYTRRGRARLLPASRFSELELSRRSPGRHGQAVIVDVLMAELEIRLCKETLPADPVDPLPTRS